MQGVVNLYYENVKEVDVTGQEIKDSKDYEKKIMESDLINYEKLEKSERDAFLNEDFINK